MARILIGTSGWTYPSWRGTFYPEDLPSCRYLECYAKAFPTAADRLGGGLIGWRPRRMESENAPRSIYKTSG